MSNQFMTAKIQSLIYIATVEHKKEKKYINDNK